MGGAGGKPFVQVIDGIHVTKRSGVLNGDDLVIMA
jgi:hypothetical protein